MLYLQILLVADAAFRMFSAKWRGVPFNVFNSPCDTPAPRFPWQPSQLKRVSQKSEEWYIREIGKSDDKDESN